ncbi:MAG: SGNH/GDSL hydrolase family protein [Clostridia bacterium]|nr:SGNH/GDSL hydrolase family protein [Clostridia bacterium]
MGTFTYEPNSTSAKLETYEWDNVWWEQTGNKTAKHILYIGDSISCGTRQHITRLSKSEILCDGFGTSKALDNPYFEPSLDLCIRQGGRYSAILFNNGLHGWHLSDAAYEEHYEKLLTFLLQTNTPVYVVLTTDDMVHPDKTEIVQRRNKIAAKLAEKYRLPVIDLYSVAIQNSDCHVPDGVHFTNQGYELLAKHILEHLN